MKKNNDIPTNHKSRKQIERDSFLGHVKMHLAVVSGKCGKHLPCISFYSFPIVNYLLRKRENRERETGKVGGKT